MPKSLYFHDYPDFKPNITPLEMFEIGIMGGSYFRPIQSPVTKTKYNQRYKKYSFLKYLPKNKYASETYDKNVNKYKKKVGTSYHFWMSKKWIREDIDPYGWIEWYCNFWQGRRSEDDIRQIGRWKRLAGENGRFRKQLQNKINQIGRNDDNVYKGMRQTLLHWGFDSTKMYPTKD
jgi:hypothetical protein